MSRSQPSTRPIPLSDIHELLVVPRRRRLIQTLAACDGWVDVGDLAEKIVDQTGVPGGADTQGVALEKLEHEDLPILHRDNVVEHESLRSRVRPGKNFEAVAAIETATRKMAADLEL